MAAYIVAICKITNPNDNLQKYIQASEALIRQHGGEYVVRSPADTVYEGNVFDGTSLVVTKFKDMTTLKGFIESEEYQTHVAPLRAGTGVYDIACYEDVGT